MLNEGEFIPHSPTPSWVLEPPDGVPAAVLVVDDNPGKRLAVSAMLARLGLTVCLAANGEEALRQLLRQDFAAILLDVRMPQMDGFETAALIHGRPRSAHTPVIFLTAEAGSDSERGRAYHLGAVDYLSLPVDPDLLCAKIRVFANLYYLRRQLSLQAEELLRSRQLMQEMAALKEARKEEEKKRIAREIHDELAQNLLALRMEASVLHARASDAHPRLREKVELALKHFDITLKSVRGIIDELRPPVLDLGLHAAIGWQVKKFRRESGIACEITAEDEDFDSGVGDAYATAVFRVLQESLSNVARHAKASKVELELCRDDRGLRLRVADNGIGMCAESCQARPALGLQGMQERVRQLAGKLEIDSAPGRGTALTVSIPL